MFWECHCTAVVYNETAMLSRTFSPVRESILIQHFNYTLVIFIRERLPKCNWMLDQNCSSNCWKSSTKHHCLSVTPLPISPQPDSWLPAKGKDKHYACEVPNRFVWDHLCYEHSLYLSPFLQLHPPPLPLFITFFLSILLCFYHIPIHPCFLSPQLISLSLCVFSYLILPHPSWPAPFQFSPPLSPSFSSLLPPPPHTLPLIPSSSLFLSLSVPLPHSPSSP